MSMVRAETLILEQESGHPVALLVTGDEFYAHHETTDGYTVVYDQHLGLYCYAELADGRLRSTEIPIHKRPPAGTRKHLQELPAVRSSKFEARFKRLYPDEQIVPELGGINFVLGPNKGLLSGRRVSRGDVTGLTILVEFQDVRSAVTTRDVEAMLVGANYTANGNHCSVREYYHQVSSGKLNYINRVVGPVRLSHDRRYYETTPLMREALLLAINNLNVDLSEFDSRNEGITDAISFLYAGRTVYGVNGDNNNPSDLWPHNSILENFQNNGIRAHFYQISSLGRSSLDLSIGTFCHESGHMLCRFPDLYDYGRRDDDFTESSGLGYYCLMSSGNHLNWGRTPAPVCGYLRDLVEWPDRLVLLNNLGTYEAQHGDYDTLLKYATDKPNEYFIVENRSGLDLDSHLPSNGLAVFHCDTEGSNEWQQGTADRHYQCALLQSDGRRDLENNRRGDAQDMFDDVPGVALADDTLPSSREWDGSDSGLLLREISRAGEVMSFSVGEDPVPASAGRVSGEVSPDLFIPDNTPEGVTSVIRLDRAGSVSAVKVAADIIHSYQGDIRLDLISPAGTRALLMTEQRRPGNDLHVSFDSANHEALRGLAGEPVEGDWTLHVRDLLPDDTGRVVRWRIEVEYTPSTQVFERRVEPALAIPDNDTTGIRSEISVDVEGMVTDIAIGLDISHTFIRDLVVELVSPAGKNLALHDRTGGGAQDIKRDISRAVLPDLETFVGQLAAGNWTLTVSDRENRDEGTLNAWWIRLSY